MRRMLALTLVMMSFAVQAGLEKFEERFEFVRKDGKLIAVRDRSLSAGFKVKTYIDYIKDNILAEQKKMRSESLDYRGELNDLFAPEATKQNINSDKGLFKEDHEYIIDSVYGLEKIDFEKVFANEKFQEVITKFESKLSDVFFYIDPMLVAKPDNGKFFYKLNATHQAVTFALNFAKKRLSTIPLLNTASYVITEVEKMIRTRRTYHQNMLLHYLETNSAEELGLNKEEADHIFSSIYESRISWFAFWESNQAANSWNRFGTDRFYQNWRLGTNRYRNYRSLYTSASERVNYAFAEVEYKGERVIVNLVDKQNMFDSKPAIAFSYDNPQKIKRMRSLLSIAELGLSFVSLPGFVKDLVNDYIKSFYSKQQITEGALLAHFEMNDQEEEIKVLDKQYINAFD